MRHAEYFINQYAQFNFALTSSMNHEAYCTHCELHLTKSEVERNFKLGRDKYSNLYCEDCEDVPPSLAQITLDVD